MDSLIRNVTSDWIHVGLASALLVLSLFFIVQVVLKGIWLIVKLRGLRKQIHLLKDHDPGSIKQEITKIFAKSPWVEQWHEYEETLHEQFDQSRPEPRVVSVRSTTLADGFFNSEVLVESPLHTEFYKHLPGILTGVGIIATFYGLITGLQNFDASASDPDALKKSLGGLFGYVQNAFLFSAVAIGLAMLFTIVEKFIYAICIHHAAGISLEIDRHFRAGVGEEYLSKLVRSSEDGATQTRQLKESLVEDLKALLTNLTERQIQATEKLSLDMGASIQKSLEVPLQVIAESVATTTRGQADQSARILEDLMSSFLAQMKESLGGQLSGLSDMMQQTAKAMGQVEGALLGLVSDMQRASESSSTGIQTAMKELLVSLAEHQRQQGEASAAQQSTALNVMQEAIVRLSNSHEASARQAYEAAQIASGRISEAAQGAIKSSRESTVAANALVESIGQVSLNAISGLEKGAEKVGSALQSIEGVTRRLEQTGNALAELQAKTAETSLELGGVTSDLGTGAKAIAQAMEHMNRASERFEDVSGVIANEAQLREATLQRLQEIMLRSNEATEKFGQLSQEVEGHLAKAVGQFGEATVQVLNDILIKYDKALGGTVDMLRQTMEELTMLVDDLNGKLRR